MASSTIPDTTTINFQTFHRFSELPSEIRVQIWDEAYMTEGPRIVEIGICHKNHGGTSSEEFVHWCRKRSTSLSPLLSANCESRQEVRKYIDLLETCDLVDRSYHLEIGAVFGRSNIYFDFDSDMLLITHNQLLNMSMFSGWLGLKGLDEVRSVLISCDLVPHNGTSIPTCLRTFEDAEVFSRHTKMFYHVESIAFADEDVRLSFDAIVEVWERSSEHQDVLTSRQTHSSMDRRLERFNQWGRILV